MTSELLESGTISRLQHQAFLGLLNFMVPYLQYARHFFNNVVLAAHAMHLSQSPKPMSRDYRNALSPWLRDQLLSSQEPFNLPPPEHLLWTDSSDEAWGAVCSSDAQTSGHWTPQELHLHITAKEALAIVRGLQARPHWHYTTVRVLSDNKAAVAMVSHLGSSKSPTLQKIGAQLLKIIQSRQLSLVATYLPGMQNVWADQLSRLQPVETEWTLSPPCFARLSTLRGPMQIDLFAHPGNHKLPLFGAPFYHPRALLVDSLQHDWNQWREIYLFPPYNMIPTVLQKLETYHHHGVLVVPFHPAALWWDRVVSSFHEISLALDIAQIVDGKEVPLPSRPFSHYLAWNF
jgi:hypothetical protein